MTKKKVLKQVLPADLFDDSRNPKGEGHLYPHRVMVSLPVNDIEKLDDVCKMIGCSRVKFMRYALDVAIEKLERDIESLEG